MNKRLLLMCVLAIAVYSLPVRAEEKISYTITITIPKVIEHSQLREQNAKDEDKKAEEEKGSDSQTYPFPEHVVIVKTLLPEP